MQDIDYIRKIIEMKNVNSILICLVAMLAFALCSCSKGESTKTQTPDVITTNDYQFNTATKKFTPADSIQAQVASGYGVKYIYNYLVREGSPDTLINIFYNTDPKGGTTSFGISRSVFSNIKMANARGIRLLVKHNDNTSYEGWIKLTTFTPPLPSLSGFPATLFPDQNNTVFIAGFASSQNGIKKIDIYDDAQGGFSLAGTISGLNNPTTYNVNYKYTYRPNAGNIKVVVTDVFDLTAEVVIKMPILPYNTFQNVMMGAQGTSTVTVTNNIFFVETGTTAGSCEIAANEATMDFLFYGTSNGPTFYSPSNTTNVAANYKCNGVGWTIGNSAVLKATKFKVLVPGSASEIDNIYAKFNANNFSDLTDDGFFAGVAVPTGSTARYTPQPTAPTSSIFNTTDAYLIWVRIPKADGTFKNCLIKAKEAVAAATTGLSTIKFDIYVQK